MYVVFGANGNTGNVVANTLIDRGERVRVVARTKEKVADLAKRGAEVAIVDVNDAESIARALSGAKGAYILLPPDLSSHDVLGRGRRIVANYVEALRRSPVPHVVALSSVAAQHSAGTGPIVTAHHAEEHLPEAKGTVFTFVRAAYFMENLLAYAGAMKGDGVLPVFGGGEGVAFPMVATRDIGEVAAELLLSPPEANRVVELAGPKDYSMNDAARIASSLVGKPVRSVVLPIDQMVPALTAQGVSENMASLYREMTEGLGRGIVAFEGKTALRRGKVTLEGLLGASLS